MSGKLISTTQITVVSSFHSGNVFLCIIVVLHWLLYVQHCVDTNKI